MKEGLPTPESKVTRERVIAAYRKFVDQGAVSPDTLNLDDPDVQEADRLFYDWQNQGNIAAEGDKDAPKRFNLEKTKLYVVAGFTDRAYLEDVLQWLNLDERDIPKQANNPERTKLRAEYARVINKIRDLLRKAE